MISSSRGRFDEDGNKEVAFVQKVVAETARDRRRSKTAHDRLQSLYQTYGISPERKTYTTLNAKAINKVKKSTTISVANRDNGELMDELMMAKTSLNTVLYDKRKLTGRVRALEEEIIGKERRYEDLLNNSICINEQQSTQEFMIKLRNSQTLVRNLKRALRDKERDLMALKAEMEKVKTSIRFTRVAELEVELKAHFQEILRLKRLLEHYKVGAPQYQGEVQQKDIQEVIRAYKTRLASDDNSTTELLESKRNEIKELQEKHSEEVEKINEEWAAKFEQMKLETTEIQQQHQKLNQVPSDREKELEQTKKALGDLTRQKMILDQTVAQLRTKEEISNQTINELQQQIRGLIDDQESREDARSIADTQYSRKQSFVFGSRAPSVRSTPLASPVAESSPTTFFSPISEAEEQQDGGLAQALSAVKATRKRPSIVTSNI